jgi:hypothetical protein
MIESIQKRHFVVFAPEKSINDVAKAIGEDAKTTQRLLKLNELIPELQGMVSFEFASG